MQQPLYLRPVGLVGADVAPAGAVPLAGGSSAFTACETARPLGAVEVAREVVDTTAREDWALQQGLEAEARDWLARLSAHQPMSIDKQVAKQEDCSMEPPCRQVVFLLFCSSARLQGSCSEFHGEN